MVPGVLCLILLMSTLVLTSMAITREREMGTLEQLIVSPIRPSSSSWARPSPSPSSASATSCSSWPSARIVFNVPIRGSMPFLLAIGPGLHLDDARAGAVHLHDLADAEPGDDDGHRFRHAGHAALRDFLSDREHARSSVQYLTYLNPLRHFGKIVREVLLKGNGPAVLWPEMVYLFVFRRGDVRPRLAPLPQAPGIVLRVSGGQ